MCWNSIWNILLTNKKPNRILFNHMQLWRLPIKCVRDKNWWFIKVFQLIWSCETVISSTWNCFQNRCNFSLDCKYNFLAFSLSHSCKCWFYFELKTPKISGYYHSLLKSFPSCKHFKHFAHVFVTVHYRIFRMIFGWWSKSINRNNFWEKS